MIWTRNHPQPGCWYWYREPGLNMNRPLPVWIFDSGTIGYAALCAVHDGDSTIRRVEHCPGEWAGPILEPLDQPRPDEGPRLRLV
jgi:hypothetical protein